MIKLTRTGSLAAIVVCTAVLSACGDDAQQRYDRATEGLQQAREQRDEAQSAVQEKQQELAKLKAKQDAAEQRLEKARAQVQQAQANVQESVNDEVLFRTLQRQLLDEDRFGDAAIAVGVSDRVVTLTGTVPDQATHDDAIKIANNQSGVAEVVDFLEIEGKAKEGAQQQE